MEIIAAILQVVAVLVSISPLLVWGIRSLAAKALDQRLEHYLVELKEVRDTVADQKISSAVVAQDVKHILEAIRRLENHEDRRD